ncbi:hypothetical protein GEMRC1_011848 [Eukaryota sp. GEM-RC1]
MKNNSKGRVFSVKKTSSVKKVEAKDARRNRAAQLRKQSRLDHITQMRHGSLPPRVVAIISLSSSIDTQSVADDVLSHCSDIQSPGIGHKSALFTDKNNVSQSYPAVILLTTFFTTL